VLSERPLFDNRAGMHNHGTDSVRGERGGVRPQRPLVKEHHACLQNKSRRCDSSTACQSTADSKEQTANSSRRKIRSPTFFIGPLWCRSRTPG
jgi:hypothetical protein